MTPEVHIVVAVGAGNEIGYQGRMPWSKMRDDMKRFREITIGHTVVMGRNTFESMGSKPLPGRTNIVVTRNSFSLSSECFSMPTFSEAYVWALHNEKEKLCAIGGVKIYEDALRCAKRIHLTRIAGVFSADRFFPHINMYHHFDDNKYQWVLRGTISYPADEQNPHPYTFEEYERVQIKKLGKNP